MLGRPSEWLRADGGPANSDFLQYTQDLEQQIAHVLRDGSTANGVYALKMFPEHFDATASCRWAERLPGLSFVYLTREDILAQAISLAIARQTQSYASWQPEAVEPIYDAAHIRRCLNFIATGEARWRTFFALNGIAPIAVTYTDLIQNPRKCIDEVATAMDEKVELPELKKIPTRIQRTERNKNWKTRFLSTSENLAFLPIIDSKLTVKDTVRSS